MIYLGLGSNQGDRRANLESAIAQLRQVGFEVSRVSPVVESPAMLPDDAEASWNVPYLNCAVEGNYSGSPQALLAEIKGIEQALGREPARRWSPRPADIDILLWHDQVIRDENLVVPHVGIVRRDFVVTPLLHLLPSLPVAGLDQSVFNISVRVPPIPLWMGILNITPDSFSDGGIWHDDGALSHQLDEFLLHNVQIVDVGAESTRPRAEEITTDAEWGRLEPVLDMVHEKVGDRYLKPWLSLDSRHASTVARAVERGIDVINDVTGLTDQDMIAIARNSGCQVVAMHAMTVPVDPGVILPSDRGATVQIREWIDQRAEAWLSAGLDLNKIIIDPGIGFGKTSIQAMEIMSKCAELRESGLRLLIGHSRKSFMQGFTGKPAPERDLETLGMSLALCAHGVDIIRVHDAVSHVRAYRAWSHIS